MSDILLDVQHLSHVFKLSKHAAVQAVDDVSFQMHKGEIFGLVGESGSGKSTIIKLLLRFYDPTSGEIFLNGRNIKEYELQKYRALFAGAFQDYQIFSM